MLYREAIDWIHATPRFGRVLGLERFRTLLARLGNPHAGLKYVHIAGTNGKGSVTAMVARCLTLAGYTTGMYISPDLEDFRERIMVNGLKIDEVKFCELAYRLKHEAEAMVKDGLEHPIQFELNTALAFMFFRDAGCDYVALEVGLGGTYDATNVVSPILSVITTISFDHMDVLGDTLEKIASEKAGIIKPGVPVVSGVIQEGPAEVIASRASQHGSPLIRVHPSEGDIRWRETSSSLESQAITLCGPGYAYENLQISLLGSHQQLNAALAVAALHALPGNPVSPDVCRAGIASTVWPGRLEIIARRPLIMLDGAHNLDGALRLKEFVHAVQPMSVICVLGVLGDKTYRALVSAIAPICNEVIATTPQSPRALPASELASALPPGISVLVEPVPQKAMDLALLRAGPYDFVLCCGSLYLVGPVRTHLRARFGIKAYGEG